MNDNRSPAPTRRHAQKRAFAIGAQLLTHPVPDVYGWTVTDGSWITGSLALADGSLDVARQQLHQWAALLAAPRWTYTRLLSRPDEAALDVAGDFDGLMVTVWATVPYVEGVTVAELATLPAVDAPAEPDCDYTPGRSPELMLGGEL